MQSGLKVFEGLSDIKSQKLSIRGAFIFCLVTVYEGLWYDDESDGIYYSKDVKEVEVFKAHGEIKEKKHFNNHRKVIEGLS